MRGFLEAAARRVVEARANAASRHEGQSGVAPARERQAAAKAAYEQAATPVLTALKLSAEYAAALRRLLTRAMEDARQVQATIEAAFIMRSLERIGDHGRNIARHVGFAGGEFDPQSTGVFAGQPTDHARG